MAKRVFPMLCALISTLSAASLLLYGCSTGPTPVPTQDPSSIQTQAAYTVLAELTANAPAPPPATDAPTPTTPAPGEAPDPNIPVAVVPTPEAGEPAAVANYNTAIYSGPGEDYVLYATFLGGDSARVIGVSADNEWWVVSIPPAPNGQGWVSDALVTVTDAESVPIIPTPPLPPSTGITLPGAGDPQVTTLASTYVRSGPGDNYQAYGIAEAGVTGRVIGKSGDGEWWVVRLDPEKVGAGFGWVEAVYTSASNVDSVQTIETPEVPISVPPSPPSAGAATATSIEYVNVRSGPGTNYPRLGIVKPGVTGEVSGKSADGAWWQVKVPEQYSIDGYGWVTASIVLTQNTENVPVVEAPPPPPTLEPTPPVGGPAGCSVAAQDPLDGTVIGPSIRFDTTWVLQNIGESEWNKDEVSIRYAGAVNNEPLHLGLDTHDLIISVQPGWTYNFSQPMISASNPGIYGELWEMIRNDEVICQIYVYIEVK